MPNTDKPIAEDKATYVDLGLEEEYKFVEQVAPLLGIDARMNPEKEDNDYAIDLIVDGKKTDLKKQETPFFTSQKKFGLSPQFTVTFNTNDYERYKEWYDGELDILFWVRWREFKAYGAEVKPMAGIWRCPFSQIEYWVENDETTFHNYLRRQNDSRNAQSSFPLSLLDMECIAAIGPHNDYRASTVNDVLFL